MVAREIFNAIPASQFPAQISCLEVELGINEDFGTMKNGASET